MIRTNCLLFFHRLPTLTSQSHHQTVLARKKLEHTSYPKSQAFGETIIDSYIVSPSSTILQSSISLNRQGTHLNRSNEIFIVCFLLFESSFSSMKIFLLLDSCTNVISWLFRCVKIKRITK
jgi:hypothetical protein